MLHCHGATKSIRYGLQTAAFDCLDQAEGPAKLMSVNVAKNSVEVRYFGDEHFRAVIAPKNCYMYPVEQLSIHLGTHKNEALEFQ